MAADRCGEVFALDNIVTLWRLDARTEEAFDARWERWLDRAGDWAPFFTSVAALTITDVITALRSLSLVDDADVQRAGTLRREGNGVSVSERYGATNTEVALLALGFARWCARDRRGFPLHPGGCSEHGSDLGVGDSQIGSEVRQPVVLKVRPMLTALQIWESPTPRSMT